MVGLGKVWYGGTRGAGINLLAKDVSGTFSGNGGIGRSSCGGM